MNLFLILLVHQKSIVTRHYINISIFKNRCSGYLSTQMSESQSMPSSLDVTSGPESSWESRVPQPITQPSSESQTQRNSFFKATEEQLKVLNFVIIRSVDLY